MLVNNVGGEMRASSMVKDSKFYIELAKFVQAYSMITLNPNDFLSEINAERINQETDFLSWEQFVKIMQNCELGFEVPPTEKELIVFYNYALEIGTISEKNKRVATVEDIANAQKHYYNFIDESTKHAEMELAKQKEISLNRDREAKEVDDKLMSLKIKNSIAIVFMTIGVFLFSFGVISLFFNNIVVSTIGKILPFLSAQYVGAFLLMIVGIVIFALLNGLFLKTKYAYLRLKDVSSYIFKRSDSAYNDTLKLKDKLDVLKEDLKQVKFELSDKNKRFDVMTNIINIAKINKFYKKFTLSDEFLQNEEKEAPAVPNEELASQKFSDEQYENVRSISKEVISMSDENGEFFDVSPQSPDDALEQPSESEEVYSEFVGETSNQAVLNERETENLKEIEKDENELIEENENEQIRI